MRGRQRRDECRAPRQESKSLRWAVFASLISTHIHSEPRQVQHVSMLHIHIYMYIYIYIYILCTYIYIYIYVVIYDNVDQYITQRGRDIDSVYICNHLCACLFV